MKKKPTINTLALGNIRQRKKQYTVLIIGIILAMIFSSGTLFFISTISTSTDEIMNNKYGSQDMITINAQYLDFESAQAQSCIEEYGFAHIIGYGYLKGGEESDGTAVAYLDEKAKELSYVRALSGRLPENKGEIALEKDALIRFGLMDKQIGDKITLVVKTPDGEKYLDKTQEKTYTLVGILRDKKRNIENDDIWLEESHQILIPAAFVCEKEQTAPGGKELLTAYFNFNDSPTYGTDYEEWINDSPNYSKAENINLRSGNSLLADILNKTASVIILTAVLVLASCVAIVNAFSSNLRERKAQIGMLRAVGATKRQIITVYAREALIISLVAAPVSSIISYLGVKLLTGFMGEDFVFRPKLWVLAASIAVGVACVMLAALIPLISASKISPMQAIRNIEITRKMKRKKIRSQKNFHVSSLLAGRSLVFGRGKQAAVSILIVITIMISSLGFALLDYMKKESQPVTNSDYEIFRSNSHGLSNYINFENQIGRFSENDRRDISASKYVSEVFGTKTGRAVLQLDALTDYTRIIGYESGMYAEKEKGLTKENYRQKIESEYDEEYSLLRQKFGLDKPFLSVETIAESDEIIKELEKNVVDGKIDLQKLASGQQVILYAPDEIGLSIYKDRTATDIFIDKRGKGEKELNANDYFETAKNTFRAGDKITLSMFYAKAYDNDNPVPDDTRKIDKTVEIGAVVSGRLSDALIRYSPERLGIYTSLDGMNALSPDAKYIKLNVNLNADCTPEIHEEITSLISNVVSGQTSISIWSNYEFAQGDKQIFNNYLTAILSVVILLFSISGSMINNALTARIREEKRQIGTLRAVGADRKTIVTSYIRQLISMFSWGYAFGFLLCVFIEIGVEVYAKVKETEPVISVQFWQPAVFCVILFAVSAFNMWTKIKKEMKHSIVENIREL